VSIDPASLRILHYPHPILRRRARAVERVDEEVQAVARRMVELMIEAEGVGLAATQVGLPWRMFVCRDRAEGAPIDTYVNPQLHLSGDIEAEEEGCLSLPEIRAPIRRSAAARLAALDLEGRSVQREASGFIARVWQHEFDHLNGVLIIDRMTPMDRLAARRGLRNLESAAG
jgi:peptide deformylase